MSRAGSTRQVVPAWSHGAKPIEQALRVQPCQTFENRTKARMVISDHQLGPGWRANGEMALEKHTHEQPYRIPFQLRSETESETGASQMILPNGGEIVAEKWQQQPLIII